ncbi:MAG TPA: radical SAM protein [Phycisphaerae bacterium]|nr:radical SAM protein [Phycisphaerae bacterium]
MAADRPKLRAWQFAGLMTTYWCNARCACCYVHGSPDRGGRLAPADAVAWWQQLDRVAATIGKRVHIHITGGEPFGDFEHLCSILSAVQQAGLGPVEKLETNAFWATDDDVATERLTAVRDWGVESLVVSTDIYHQQFVPIEAARRCERIGRQVFGQQHVHVRWPEELDEPSAPEVFAPDACTGVPGTGGQAPSGTPSGSGSSLAEAFRRAFAQHRERLTGRAAFELAPLLERRPAETFARLRCKKAILKSRHVHVDPYGNVFPGTCSGIILSNARHEPIDAMWQRLGDQWDADPVLRALVTGGPCALMQQAIELGYEPLPDGYAGKCHLCTHVRQWFHDHGCFPGTFGPRECYLSPAGEPAPSRALGA